MLFTVLHVFFQERSILQRLRNPSAPFAVIPCFGINRTVLPMQACIPAAGRWTFSTRRTNSSDLTRPGFSSVLPQPPVPISFMQLWLHAVRIRSCRSRRKIRIWTPWPWHGANGSLGCSHFGREQTQQADANTFDVHDAEAWSLTSNGSGPKHKHCTTNAEFIGMAADCCPLTTTCAICLRRI